MKVIKPGYQVALIDPDGIFIDTIDLEGYNLEKSMALGIMANDIKALLPEEAYEEAGKAGSDRGGEGNELATDILP